MSTPRWYLARRITWRVAVTTSVLLVLLAGFGLLSVNSAVEAQIEALTREEIEEIRAAFGASNEDLGALGEIVEDLQEEHPDNRMAFLVWESDGGRRVAEHGDIELFDSVELDQNLGYVRYSGNLRGNTASLSESLRLTLVLDGRPERALLQRFLLGALGFVGLAVLLSFAVASLLGRRIAGLLRRAAVGVRLAGVGGGQDLIEQEDLPEEIRDVVQALSETLASIRRESDRARLMTSGMAHELRSPIQNMLGEAEVALLRERTPEAYRSLIESQLEELRDLARAIDNLVTLCAADETRRTGGAEHFDLAGELERRLERERSVARRRSIDLRTELRGPLDVEGDREALVLAVRNLITNALDWAGDDGVVALTARHDGDLIRVDVEDSGPGVAPRDRERIFEPFRQGTPRSGRRIGFGLGLALTRTAVENQGGSIEVGESKLGGARFTALLPDHPKRRARSAG